MDEKYIGNRITELRIKLGVSEYQMSMDLGHSGSYIKSISSYRALPSMKEFMYICEYFKITPEQFFDAGNKNPVVIEDITQKVRALSESDLALVSNIINRLLAPC